MDKETARKLIEETFQNPFNKELFVYFVQNLFNHIEIEDKHPYSGTYIPAPYRPFISTLKRVAKYVDAEDKKIDILIVKLKRETSLERARSMQRNFIGWYLNGSRGGILKDAALVAFVSPNSEDWRFSLVKMDYRIDASGKKIKVKQELTPTRRFSFLVGKNESSHTAQSRLVPILENDITDPTLKDLEDAFNIEKVTKEFFEKYRNLFHEVEDELDKILKKDKKVRQNFKKHNIDTVDFAKKLLGQIVFLYFLQKKGWFGVERDEDWGTGPKDFLRGLFNREYGNYQNFFNDILEPLFYEALAVERTDDFYSRFNCKIPFLNGGLFDPMNNYDWVHADILLPNELFFNNTKTKEDDVGTGILNIFNRYNFTVKEDEPLEKEVAIDPEMLGKVFENLLEVKDRKSKGTYYTPREIVHYMCQQSLINYLFTSVNNSNGIYQDVGEKQTNFLGNKTKKGQLKFIQKHKTEIVSKQDIEIFIKHGESIFENEKTAKQKKEQIKQGQIKTTKFQSKLPQSIIENAKLIDNKLEIIRVCDPAIGSGAFPIGMMNEIVRARNSLSTFIKNKKNRTVYDFKRHAIQNCLYGVDIDPGAVEIAKLRLWLSLIVEEEDIKQIKPLPNLDYKIVCGNSLLGVEKNLFNQKLFNELEQLKPLYFNETNARRKQDYKEKIDKLISRITNGHKDFDFEVYFSEVFHEKKGFDVVIGNPPYVQIQKFSGQDIQKQYEKARYKTFKKTGDIYALFYERGLEMAKRDAGLLCYITSNKWMRAGYGESLRKYFSEKNPLQLLDFGGFKVFESATVDTNILLIQNADNKNKLQAVHFKNDYKQGEEIVKYFNENKTELKNLSSDTWFIGSKIEIDLKKKIEERGLPLKDWDVKIYRGILTGFNEAFIIDTATKEKLCKEDSRSLEIIKPILRGRDIKKYRYEFRDKWIINTGFDLDIQKLYPAVFKWLKQFESKLKKRDDQGKNWWNLRACAYYEEFEKEKIIYPETTLSPNFYLDIEGFFYVEKTGFILVGSNIKFITGIFSSLLGLYIYKNYCSGVILGEKGYQYNKHAMEKMVIPKITSQNKIIVENIENLVDQILKKKKDNPDVDTGDLEREIDERVYGLYGLGEKEVEIIESEKVD